MRFPIIICCLGAMIASGQDFYILPSAFALAQDQTIVLRFAGSPAIPANARALSPRGSTDIGPSGQLRVAERGNVLVSASRILANGRKDFAKALLLSGGRSAEFSFVLGTELEIVPEDNPYLLQSGEELTLRLLSHGNPVENAKLTALRLGAEVEAAESLTDASGRVTVPLPHRGIYKICAVVGSLSATLLFELEEYFEEPPAENPVP